MKVLILGSGGREHAFAFKLAESNKITQLFVAPGNGGTQELAINLDINPTDFEAVKKTVLENAIEMVVVGPEAPLVAGIHDFFLSDAPLHIIFGRLGLISWGNSTTIMKTGGTWELVISIY